MCGLCVFVRVQVFFKCTTPAQHREAVREIMVFGPGVLSTVDEIMWATFLVGRKVRSYKTASRMVQMQDKGCGAGSHTDELLFRTEYFFLHTAAIFECDVGRKGVAASLMAFAKQALLARSGGDSTLRGAEGVLQHNVQHPSAGSAEGPEPEVLVDVPNPPGAVGSSTTPASLTGELPVGKEGRRGDLKRRQEVEEQEVRQDAE